MNLKRVGIVLKGGPYKEALRGIEKVARNGDTFLDLSDLGLEALPPEIGRLTQLTHLYVRGNQLTSLPPEIGRLTQLTQLAVGDNQLTSLPPEIGRLMQLTELYVYDNRLASLPPEIGRLTQLTQLAVFGNQLTSLPPEIWRLTQLTNLNVGANQLTSLPPEIGRLTQLTHLYVGGNRLTSLPQEIGRLTQLTRLYVDTNRLTSLPPEIGGLTRLTELELRFNPVLIDPPSHIVEQGTAAILEYLRAKTDGPQRRLLRSKMLIVGQPGAGKTNLVRLLRGEGFESQESTTVGIELGELRLEHPDPPGEPMTLSTWDFGGQDIQQATHQFFLSEQALILVLWNVRQGYEQSRLDYWLETIDARAPGAPVLIVGAHGEDWLPNLPLAELQAKYKNIRGSFTISNKTGAGIEGLREAIRVEAARLPLMNESWPETWYLAAKAVRDCEHQWLPREELKSLVRSKLGSDEEAKIVWRSLHHLGDILFFDDRPELNQIAILKPQWITQHIARVLQSQEVAQRGAVFTREDRATIWSDLKEPLREQFVRFMEGFDLSYPVEGVAGSDLVVELLPVDEADYAKAWAATEGQPELRLTYRLSSLQPGLPTWLIARCHRFSTGIHWRFGGLFRDEEHKKHALVKALPFAKTVSIVVRGPNPSYFFYQIRERFEDTLRRFEGLQVGRFVPCSTAGCLGEFELSDLEGLVEDEEPTVRCLKCRKNQKVEELLGGFRWKAASPASEDVSDIRETVHRIESVVVDSHEMLQTMQRVFLSQFTKIQKLEESMCPNTYVLSTDSKNWRRALVGTKWKLHLCCQSPECSHPVVEGSGGIYDIDDPAEWLRKMAPYTARVIGVLKFAAHFLPVGIGGISKAIAEEFKEQITLSQELIKELPEIKDEGREGFASDAGLGRRTLDEGYELRELRSFLDRKDSQQTWGKLTRVWMPEGDYLWLCPICAAKHRS